MRKQVIEYTSPLDALIALTKQLNVYEIKYQMSSEDFFAKYNQGLLMMKCLSNGQEIISII